MLALAGHDPCVAICVYERSVDRVISRSIRPTCRNLIETAEVSVVTCLRSQARGSSGMDVIPVGNTKELWYYTNPPDYLRDIFRTFSDTFSLSAFIPSFEIEIRQVLINQLGLLL